MLVDMDVQLLSGPFLHGLKRKSDMTRSRVMAVAVTNPGAHCAKTPVCTMRVIPDIMADLSAHLIGPNY